MQILSFDTCGSDVHIAFMQDGVIVAQEIIQPAQKNRQEAASSLLPAIDRLMKEIAWDKRNLDLIVVGVGPGSFTGVRVSVITARSLGQALNCAVVPISVLELMASNSSRPCAVVLNAGAGKFYAGAFDSDSQAKTGLFVEAFCGDQEELCTKLAALDTWVTLPDLDLSKMPVRKNISVYPEGRNLASDAALLVGKRICDGMQKLDRESLALAYPWDNVLPLYLRSPSVTMKAENGSSNKTPAGG